MSRSYKKVPGFTDYSRGRTKWAKRQASKKVRHTEDVPNGKGYRKLYNPWDIRDWKYLYFCKDDYIDIYNVGRHDYSDPVELYRLINK